MFKFLWMLSCHYFLNISQVLLFSSENNPFQGQENVNANLKEEIGGNSMFNEDAFSTPCFKANPNAFVSRRSNYSKQPECSPVPDAFTDFADEDTWMKMNRGYVADLDVLHITPARKVQSLPSTNVIAAILIWFNCFLVLFLTKYVMTLA